MNHEKQNPGKDESASPGDKDDSYERAMRSALARKPFPKTDGKYLTREEIYDRKRMREIEADIRQHQMETDGADCTEATNPKIEGP